MPYKVGKTLSGSIVPSGRSNANSTAYRVPGDILLPDGQDQLRHGHPGKTRLKALAFLDGEDEFQVSFLVRLSGKSG